MVALSFILINKIQENVFVCFLTQTATIQKNKIWYPKGKFSLNQTPKEVSWREHAHTITLTTTWPVLVKPKQPPAAVQSDSGEKRRAGGAQPCQHQDGRRRDPDDDKRRACHHVLHYQVLFLSTNSPASHSCIFFKSTVQLSAIMVNIL